MTYDYIIIGLGPTGITTGLNLMKTNKTVLLLDIASKIGGCWKVDYQNNKYFSEHSPKVLSKYGSEHFNKLLRLIHINPDYKTIYKRSMVFDMTLQFIKYFTLCDIMKLIFAFIFYLLCLDDKGISIYDWTNKNDISLTAKKYLNIISIAASTTYDKLKLNVLFKFFTQNYKYVLFDTYQLAKPDMWLSKCHQYFTSHSNFTLEYDCSVDKISVECNTVKEIHTSKGIYKANKFIFCVPISSMYHIMKSSSFLNWFSNWKEYSHFINQSSYTGIGFQLHLDYQLNEKEWCSSCFGDWNVIFQDKASFIDKLSNDKTIKSVLSCVIVDLDTKSKRTNKTPNECSTIQEIVDEAIFQIRQTGYDLRKPVKITFSKNISKTNGKWTSIDTSYANSIGILPYKGKLNNLYSVGPHNLGEITIIESAIKSGNIFCRNELNIDTFF